MRSLGSTELSGISNREKQQVDTVPPAAFAQKAAAPLPAAQQRKGHRLFSPIMRNVRCYIKFSQAGLLLLFRRDDILI